MGPKTYWPKKGYPNFNHEEDHPFVDAILTGNYYVVQDMIEHGTEVNCYYRYVKHHAPFTYHYTPPLGLALIKKSPAIVRLLLMYGANANLRYWNQIYNPLAYAVERGLTRCTIALLEYGADPNSMGIYDIPLSIAASKGFTDIMELLLKAGARIDGNEYSIPLVKAIRRKKTDSLQYLLEQGATVNLPKFRLHKCLPETDQKDPCSGYCDLDVWGTIFSLHRIGYTEKQRTPFQVAMIYRDIELIKLLVTYGAITEFRYDCSMKQDTNEFLMLLRGVGCDFGFYKYLFGRIYYDMFEQPMTLKEACRRTFYLKMQGKDIRKELKRLNVSIPLTKYMLFEEDFF